MYMRRSGMLALNHRSVGSAVQLFPSSIILRKTQPILAADCMMRPVNPFSVNDIVTSARI